MGLWLQSLGPESADICSADGAASALLLHCTTSGSISDFLAQVSKSMKKKRKTARAARRRAVLRVCDAPAARRLTWR